MASVKDAGGKVDAAFGDAEWLSAIGEQITGKFGAASLLANVQAALRQLAGQTGR